MTFAKSIIRIVACADSYLSSDADRVEHLVCRVNIISLNLGPLEQRYISNETTCTSIYIKLDSKDKIKLKHLDKWKDILKSDC